MEPGKCVKNILQPLTLWKCHRSTPSLLRNLITGGWDNSIKSRRDSSCSSQRQERRELAGNVVSPPAGQMANWDPVTLLSPYSRGSCYWVQTDLTGSAPGSGQNSQTGGGVGPSPASEEVDECLRSSRSPPASSADSLVVSWASCAAFSSWFTPVASARQRHDSGALSVPRMRSAGPSLRGWEAGEALRWPFQEDVEGYNQINNRSITVPLFGLALCYGFVPYSRRHTIPFCRPNVAVLAHAGPLPTKFSQLNTCFLTMCSCIIWDLRSWNEKNNNYNARKTVVRNTLGIIYRDRVYNNIDVWILYKLLDVKAITNM